MPHINIKHFPIHLTHNEEADLISKLTKTITQVFKCPEDVVSIALEPIEKDLWDEQVYIPEFVTRGNLLKKLPNY